jgi:superfamily II DNA or RNA helicase
MDYKALYEEMLKRYNQLEQENKRLLTIINSCNKVDCCLQNGENDCVLNNQTDNALSKNKACFTSQNNNADYGLLNTIHKVTKQSSPEEKVALYRSLFRGRDDVYAKRWYNAKIDKSGYSPVCENEWGQVLCDKRQIKCNVCKNRKLQPLTDEVITAHLKGKSKFATDVVGLYPLTTDECCYFIAIDFDDERWKEDISAFFAVCKQKHIRACIERSRSGNGGHVWIFFNNKISATKARKLASLLLTCTMEQNHSLSFSSYDRMFPNQDTMPSGGFGNLIALPLQGCARLNGNSLFVNENFVAYEDQWEYLSTIQKITEEQVDEVLHSLKGSELGELKCKNEEVEQYAAPKQLVGLDSSITVKITIANMIYVEKDGLSESVLNKIKRLAAFKNPEYYKAQKMRLPVYNKPRIIATDEEAEDYIAIPRGCFDRLIQVFDGFCIAYHIIDKRNEGKSINVEFNGELREEQTVAFETLASNDIGVLSATTAFGKTVIGAKLIAEKKVNTLVLVHTAALLNQWKSSLSKFLILNNQIDLLTKKRGRKKEVTQIGQLGATKNTLNGYVDIAIIQSLFNGDEVKELVKDYGMIIVDECHHIPAVSFESVMKSVYAKYVYGLTATPVRQDGHQNIIFMQCGDIRYKVDAKEQAQRHGFDHTVIPRFTNFHMPIDTSENMSIQTIFEKLCESNVRNNLIVEDAKKLVNEGRNIIILTERRSHAQVLAEEISKAAIKTYLLVGAETAKMKRDKLAEIANAAAQDKYVIVATGKYVGEGFDEARLDTLLLAMPISWKGKLAQYVGRLHRQYAGKNEVIVYDYVDIHVAVLERMYHKRIVGYREIGYNISVEENGKKSGILFDKNSFRPIFNEDMLNAKKSIFIACPTLRDGMVKAFISLIESMIEKPAITIITRHICANETIMTANISIKIKEDLNGRFAVIDDSLVWYGNINFLNYNSEDATTLRFESTQTAKELLETLMV